MQPKIKLAPVALTAEDQEQLSIALGGPEEFCMLEESEFLAHSECPPEELENWLENCWVQYDIQAVLAGSEQVGRRPHVLVCSHQDPITLRLLCPTEELLRKNALADAWAQLLELITARPWVENCEEIISQMAGLTSACKLRTLPTSEIKLLWAALWVAIAALVELRDTPYPEQMERLHTSTVEFAQAWRARGDASPQARYSEARVSARRALSEGHNAVLDGFPKLVDIARGLCSQELASYLADEVRLDTDQFLDMLGMLAHDGADPASVANPPARIRHALVRQEVRRKALYRNRWQQPTPRQMDALEGPPGPVDSEVIAQVDWERTKRDLALPPDAAQAVEARRDGGDLQAAGAAKDLGWDAARLRAVRRSLEPDRKWGRRLRQRMRAYRPKDNAGSRDPDF